jgi:hypothetical protein
MTMMKFPLLLALLMALGCSDAGEDSAEDVGVVASTLPKDPTHAGGKCHVSFGPYTIIVAGTYASDGSCCGKALCTDGCGPGQKYVDVCIDCGADPDVQCGDGHHPVAHVQSAVLVLGAASQSFATAP